MAGERRYMNRINGWAQIIAGATSIPDETKHLEPGVIRLRELHTRVSALSVQQAALTTTKQETTQELQRLIREGDALADFLRTGARAHFGADSEKMIQFGMQPFRGRKLSLEAKAKRAKKSKAAEASAPEAETSAADKVE